MTFAEIRDTLVECGYTQIGYEFDSFVRESIKDLPFDECVGFTYMVEDLVTQAWEKYNKNSQRPVYGVNDMLYSQVFGYCDALGFHLATECETLVVHGSSLEDEF